MLAAQTDDEDVKAGEPRQEATLRPVLRGEHPDRDVGGPSSSMCLAFRSPYATVSG